MMKPWPTIIVHQSLCAECAYKARDPCAKCEHGKWGQYQRDCGKTVAETSRRAYSGKVLVIRDTSSVPSRGWHYPVEATGFDVLAPNYNAIFDAVKTHCQSNSVPYPGDQAIIDYFCANLDVPCYDSETRQPLVNAFTLGLPNKPTSCCGKR